MRSTAIEDDVEPVPLALIARLDPLVFGQLDVPDTETAARWNR